MLDQKRTLKQLQNQGPSDPEGHRCVNSLAEDIEISGRKLLISLELIILNKLKEFHPTLQMPTVQPLTTPKFFYPLLPSPPSHKTETRELFSFSSYLVREKFKFYEQRNLIEGINIKLFLNDYHIKILSALTSTNTNSYILAHTALPYKALAHKHCSKPNYDGSVKQYLLLQQGQQEFANSFQEIICNCMQNLWNILYAKFTLYRGQSPLILILRPKAGTDLFKSLSVIELLNSRNKTERAHNSCYKLSMQISLLPFLNVGNFQDTLLCFEKIGGKMHLS